MRGPRLRGRPKALVNWALCMIVSDVAIATAWYSHVAKEACYVACHESRSEISGAASGKRCCWSHQIESCMCWSRRTSSECCKQSWRLHITDRSVVNSNSFSTGL